MGIGRKLKLYIILRSIQIKRQATTRASLGLKAHKTILPSTSHHWVSFFQARGGQDFHGHAGGRCGRAAPLQRREGVGQLRGRGGGLAATAAAVQADGQQHGRAAEQERDQDLGGLAEGLRQNRKAVV